VCWLDPLLSSGVVVQNGLPVTSKPYKDSKPILPLGYTEKHLMAQAADVEAAYRARSQDDFNLFILGLTIPSEDKGPKLLKSVIADFQLETFSVLAPSLKAIRDGSLPERRRFWIERTKKAGKDSDLAICLCWLMAFPVRPILVQIVASDQDQAAIIKRRVEELLFHNPWLKDRIKVVQNKIKGHGGMGEVVIESTDTSGGAHGETPDLLILNELVHVKKWSVMDTHMNNADGVPRGVVIISTNAGIRGTMAWKWRQDALADPFRWTCKIRSEVAPWIGKDDVEAARKRDPVGAEFARLWKGRWISGRGGAVDDESIDGCFVLPGPTTRPESGWQYVAGLDLGVSHDHSGIVVIGANTKLNRIKVCWIRGFEPSIPNDKGIKEVDCDAVEGECLDLFRTFHIQWFGYDPAAGGSFMAQRLRKKGMPMRDMTFSKPKNCTEMATAFVLAVKDGKLECYEDKEGRLRRDFGKFSIVPKVPSGYKLEAVSDEYGHADVGTALIICLPTAMTMIGGFSCLLKDDDMFGGDDVDLSDDEVAEMPDELRDIYESMGLDEDKRPPKVLSLGNEKDGMIVREMPEHVRSPKADPRAGELRRALDMMESE